MQTSLTVGHELHVRDASAYRFVERFRRRIPRVGTASVHVIPGYTGYDEDESVAHYSEHPGIRKLIGPMEADAAWRLAENLTAVLRELGCQVELLDVVDD